ncbi:MAG: class I SAM-dependent methyltransferase [Microbacterium sp.]
MTGHGHADGQRHGHGHAARTWDDQAESLQRSAEVSAQWVEEAVAWVTSQHPSSVRLVIDAGCGAGFAARALAHAVPDARVLAVDQNQKILDIARDAIAGDGLQERVRTVQADLEEGLASLGPADIIWASAVVHHLPDPVRGLSLIGEALAPHGILAVAEGGLPMRVLPGGYGVGRPSFLPRVEAALSDYFVREWSLTDAAVGGKEDWRSMLAAAGFEPLASKTFLLDHPAPVSGSVRAHVHTQFAEVRSLIGNALESADRSALDVLLDDDDPRSFARRTDLFLLSAHTVHLAMRVA